MFASFDHALRVLHKQPMENLCKSYVKYGDGAGRALPVVSSHCDNCAEVFTPGDAAGMLPSNLSLRIKNL